MNGCLEKHGNEKYRQQAICESYLSQEMKPTSCGMHLTLEFFDTSQSIISLLSLLESSTSDFKCVAEKKPFDMYSMCSSGDGGGPESGFTGIPILSHSSLRPLRVATDGTAGGLVKPRTLMGAVGRREAWLRGIPAPTPTSATSP